MFSQVKIPILGVIENMSEFICPHCGKPSKIFSSGGGKKLSESFHATLLGNIPMLPQIMESGENGNPIVNLEKSGVVAKAYNAIADKLKEELAKLE